MYVDDIVLFAPSAKGLQKTINVCYAYGCDNILLNLRSPRDSVGSFAPVVHVLDRKLLERLMSPSPKSQVMFASAFS